jgi:hypothetical protein
VDTASRLIEDVKDDQSKEKCLRDLVRDRGGDPDVLDPLASLLAAVTGRGQLGATRRAGSRHTRAGAELSWLDGPAGRVRISRADDGWVSINSLRRNELRFAIGEMAATAR